jgi:hypothetical protein
MDELLKARQAIEADLAAREVAAAMPKVLALVSHGRYCFPSYGPLARTLAIQACRFSHVVPSRRGV